MKNILSKLLEKWLCKHDWELFRETEVFFWGSTVGYEYIFICKKCGKIKKIKS